MQLLLMFSSLHQLSFKVILLIIFMLLFSLVLINLLLNDSSVWIDDFLVHCQILLLVAQVIILNHSLFQKSSQSQAFISIGLQFSIYFAVLRQFNVFRQIWNLPVFVSKFWFELSVLFLELVYKETFHVLCFRKSSSLVVEYNLLILLSWYLIVILIHCHYASNLQLLCQLFDISLTSVEIKLHGLHSSPKSGIFIIHNIVLDFQVSI
jgi:hypothetical protein